ncbi:MAG: hypothetical protein IPK58_25200 [Acidobacteria bacterium]|nr:hypothetical protein [Acidobacteriota bacterium]
MRLATSRLQMFLSSPEIPAFDLDVLQTPRKTALELMQEVWRPAMASCVVTNRRGSNCSCKTEEPSALARLPIQPVHREQCRNQEIEYQLDLESPVHSNQISRAKELRHHRNVCKYLSDWGASIKEQQSRNNGNPERRIKAKNLETQN